MRHQVPPAFSAIEAAELFSFSKAKNTSATVFHRNPSELGGHAEFGSLGFCGVAFFEVGRELGFGYRCGPFPHLPSDPLNDRIFDASIFHHWTAPYCLCLLHRTGTRLRRWPYLDLNLSVVKVRQRAEGAHVKPPPAGRALHEVVGLGFGAAVAFLFAIT